VFDDPSSARLRVDLQEFAVELEVTLLTHSAAGLTFAIHKLCSATGNTDDSAALVKDTHMKTEVESALRKTERGKYLVEACKSDPDLTEAVESAYADATRAERERQLAIDRVGGPDAFKAAELLASTMQRVRKGQ
jgi:hypothetical protein